MSDILLEGKNVTQKFGGLTAVSKVSFCVERGQIVAIIGPNGAGKSTLFNCVTGIYTPTEGTIHFRGENITTLKTHQIASLGIARTFQNIRLFNEMTVIENVIVGMHHKTKANWIDSLFHLKRYKSEEKQCVEKAEEILKLMELSEYKYNYSTALPYGLQRRLEIARAIASDPELLLLDEPAAGMNEQETIDLMNLIAKLRDMGFTILLIEHDMKLVMGISDNIYVLNRGELIAQGSAEEIQSNPLVIEAYLGTEE